MGRMMKQARTRSTNLLWASSALFVVAYLTSKGGARVEVAIPVMIGMVALLLRYLVAVRSPRDYERVAVVVPTMLGLGALFAFLGDWGYAAFTFAAIPSFFLAQWRGRRVSGVRERLEVASLDPVYDFPPSQEFCVTPKFTVREDVVELNYDQEEPDGEYISRCICFYGVLGCRKTRLSSCQPWMFAAYDRLCEVADSVWIWQLCQERGIHSHHGVHHYAVYFDDHGFYEVVAERFQARAVETGGHEDVPQ